MPKKNQKSVNSPFNIKIFHLNGCGPTPKDCGQTPGPDSKYHNDMRAQFIHMDMSVGDFGFCLD